MVVRQSPGNDTEEYFPCSTQQGDCSELIDVLGPLLRWDAHTPPLVSHFALPPNHFQDLPEPMAARAYGVALGSSYIIISIITIFRGLVFLLIDTHSRSRTLGCMRI